MLPMIELRGPSNEVFLLEKGELDQRAWLAFIYGQCHGLALAVHRRTGWPLVAVVDHDGVCEHICVRRPDGQIIDVTGAHTSEEMGSARGGTTHDISVDYIDDLQAHHGWARPEPDLAGAWVDSVLVRAASPSTIPALKRPTVVVTKQLDDDLAIKFEWHGAKEMDVHVRRTASAPDNWTFYGPVGFRTDTNGVWRVNFVPEELERIAQRWLDSKFDRVKAERTLAEISPTDHTS